MPTKIPIVLLLLKERADSLRRSVEIIQAGCEEQPTLSTLRQALSMLQDLTRMEEPRCFAASPAMALEWALEWACSSPPPPVAALREARTVLEASAASWAESFVVLRGVLERQIHRDEWPWPVWIYEMARVAASEQRRIQTTLRESWPVASEADENQLLTQMKGGQSLSLDEAFVLASGGSAEDWAAKVRAHKTKKQG